MKSLAQYIAESQIPMKGKSTISELFRVVINPDTKTLIPRDFEEVQKDDLFLDTATNKPIDPETLYNEYKDNGETEVRWTYDSKNTQYKVEGGNFDFSFNVTEPYKNGLNW